MRVSDLARRLLIAALGTLALGVGLALLFGAPPFTFVAAPLAWLLVSLAAWGHYRRSSKIEAWERAKAEAQQRDKLEALDVLRDRRASRSTQTQPRHS